MKMKWQEKFKEGKELVLSTCLDGKPNANVVISLGMTEGNVMVADCSMKTTIENLKKNPNICVLGGYIKIIGKAKIFSSGRYFDECVKRTVLFDKTYKVKNAILIEIEKIIDLDKVEVIK